MMWNCGSFLTPKGKHTLDSLQLVVYRYESCINFYILLTVHPNIMSFFFTNLMHKFFILIHLLYSSTCFEHYYAHLQEDNCVSTASGIVTLETNEWSKLLKYIVCCIV
jgi:hypothetical protein